jgi:hypothetical protein
VLKNRICQKKYAKLVVVHLVGEKNGSDAGTKYSIVARAVRSRSLKNNAYLSILYKLINFLE